MRARTSASHACGSMSFILADDQAVHHRGALAAAIGAAEQPGLPTQSDAAHATLGRIVRQANAAVLKEARERGPAFSAENLSIR